MSCEIVPLPREKWKGTAVPIRTGNEKEKEGGNSPCEK